MSASNPMLTDYELARQLQRAELGLPPDLDRPENRAAAGPAGAINYSRQQQQLSRAQAQIEMTHSVQLYSIVLCYVPQIIAAMIIVPLKWSEDLYCGERSIKWRVWALMSAVRMLLYCSVVVYIRAHTERLRRHDRLQLEKLISTRNIVDALGIVWFVVGNIWVFAQDENGHTCANPTRDPVYSLCVTMLVVSYVQVLFPCILAVLMIPVLCFCMPCVIRLLARYQNYSSTVGLREQELQLLPSMVIAQSDLSDGANSDNNSCPICLSDLCVGEEGRSMPQCNHLFHKACIDEWLKVNATCPTCRQSLLSGSELPVDAAAGAAGGYGQLPTSERAAVHETGGGRDSSSNISFTTSDGRNSVIHFSF